MPGPTLYKYFRADKSKRQSIGNGVGRNSRMLTEGGSNFIGDVLDWSDHGNNSMSCQEAIDALQGVNPTMYRKQAKDMLEQRALPKSFAYGKIKKNTLKLQTTTTEWTSITYQSQWNWYEFFMSMFDNLWRKNGRICNNNGKTFGQFMQHFVLVLDEACIMADAGGNIRMI